jgi:hypothetical protein
MPANYCITLTNWQFPLFQKLWLLHVLLWFLSFICSRFRSDYFVHVQFCFYCLTVFQCLRSYELFHLPLCFCRVTVRSCVSNNKFSHCSSLLYRLIVLSCFNTWRLSLVTEVKCRSSIVVSCIAWLFPLHSIIGQIMPLKYCSLLYCLTIITCYNAWRLSGFSSRPNNAAQTL